MLAQTVERAVLAQAVSRMLSRPAVAQRDAARVLDEYDHDKYGAMLRRDPRTFEDLLTIEAGLTGRRAREVEWISRGDELVSGMAGDHDALQLALVMETLQANPSPRYCELGCGFGRFLQAGSRALPEGEFYGGELSRNGRMLGKRFGLDVHAFDFTRIEDYGLIRPETTVFTVQAIEHLESALDVVTGLRKMRQHVRRVIHIEPGPHPQRRGAWGHLRDAYSHWNGYNRDLVGLLKHTPDVRIVDERYDVLGVNPLNPVHVIVWEFVNGLVY